MTCHSIHDCEYRYTIKGKFFPDLDIVPSENPNCDGEQIGEMGWIHQFVRFLNNPCLPEIGSPEEDNGKSCGRRGGGMMRAALSTLLRSKRNKMAHWP